MNRPKRQATKNLIFTETKAIRCNPANFVGYVEDLETPEMIMKKFEALEDYTQQLAQAKEEGGDEGNSKKKKKEEEEKDLSEEELQELFKRTSNFSAQSIMTQPKSGEVLVIQNEFDDEPEYYHFDEGWDMTGIIQDEDSEGEAYFVCAGDSDSENEDEAWEELLSDGVDRKFRKRGGLSGVSRSSRSSVTVLGGKLRQVVKRVRRRKETDPNAISLVRIPEDPIPSSWAKRILQYVPPNYVHVKTSWNSDDVLLKKPVQYSPTPDVLTSKSIIADNMLDFKSDLLKVAKECQGFHGVVLSPPWKEPRPGVVLLEGIVPEDLLKLPLGSREFLPAGFLYIWTPKHWLARTLVALEKMDLHYVENAVVVNERVGDSGPPFPQPCMYFSQQKETLLVCRRGTKHPTSGKLDWEPIELRHQRISDVHLACYQPSTFREDIPMKPINYVHKMVETMLPASRFNSDLPDVKPRLCELWAQKGKSRTGWVTVESAM